MLLILSGCVCVSDPGLLLHAARFTTGYVRLVGQEPAPSKCVLLSTSRVVRGEVRNWILSDEGDKWAPELDVRDLGGHLDTTREGLVFHFICACSPRYPSPRSGFCPPSGLSWACSCSSDHVHRLCPAWC